ncbi:hypothetical protein JIG36_24840 [Actinoplanes sp. LDG1-06]|uniref:ATP-grasp domain-containing protein n=1 Tax=Paractinoplanes ovalisporus TaxID=2810368 RepID=A0ABS2AG46_9ACTN|nr:hypothetical protein [Actinoplanes ovalisporus]MBM2618790.1 hypothetical protein [Actinoplanes ovalisporus]
MRLALVTSTRLPEAHWRDVDAEPLTAALTAEGVTVDQVPWDGDNPVDWSAYDVLVVQSPWSMWVRMAEFEAWLGIGEFPEDRLEAAVAHARSILDTGLGVLVQPYVAAIDTHRELAVVMLDGRVSHAITKAAILRPGTAERAFHPDPRVYELSARQIEVALTAYGKFLSLRPPGGPPVYSVRLDFLIDPDTAPGLRLLEVEAVAPVKFLSLVPERVVAFARVLGSTRG